MIRVEREVSTYFYDKGNSFVFGSSDGSISILKDTSTNEIFGTIRFSNNGRIVGFVQVTPKMKAEDEKSIDSQIDTLTLMAQGAYNMFHACVKTFGKMPDLVDLPFANVYDFQDVARPTKKN